MPALYASGRETCEQDLIFFYKSNRKDEIKNRAQVEIGQNIFIFVSMEHIFAKG